jgi:hypothetical protein
MNPMLLFAYADARRADVERALQSRHFGAETTSVRDRLGRALISIGEQLLGEPVATQQEVRRAA